MYTGVDADSRNTYYSLEDLERSSFNLDTEERQVIDEPGQPFHTILKNFCKNNTNNFATVCSSCPFGLKRSFNYVG